MKTFLRISAILTAILAVVGILYWAGTAGPLAQSFGDAAAGRGQPRAELSRDSGSQSVAGQPTSENRRGFDDHEGRGGAPFSLTSMAGFLKTLLPISLILMVAAIVTGMSRRNRRRKKAHSPQFNLSEPEEMVSA